MSFAIDALRQLRDNAIAQIAEYNRQVNDIDAVLAAVEPQKQAGAGNAPEPQSPHYDHVHWGHDGAGEVQLYDNVGALPSAVIPPQAAPQPEYPPFAAPTPEQAVSTVVQASQPEPPLTAQENAQPRPWEQQAAEDAAPPAPAEPKKGGRRTNEEIAADHGVKLEDVKAWLGPEGGRVTAGKIKEFAELHPDAVALPGGAEQPTLPEPAPAPPAEPVRPPEPTADVPPAEDWEDADAAPVVGSAPGWDPFASTGTAEKPPF